MAEIKYQVEVTIALNDMEREFESAIMAITQNLPTTERIKVLAHIRDKCGMVVKQLEEQLAKPVEEFKKEGNI